MAKVGFDDLIQDCFSFRFSFDVQVKSTCRRLKSRLMSKAAEVPRLAQRINPKMIIMIHGAALGEAHNQTEEKAPETDLI